MFSACLISEAGARNIRWNRVRLPTGPAAYQQVKTRHLTCVCRYGHDTMQRILLETGWNVSASCSSESSLLHSMEGVKEFEMLIGGRAGSREAMPHRGNSDPVEGHADQNGAVGWWRACICQEAS